MDYDLCSLCSLSGRIPIESCHGLGIRVSVCRVEVLHIFHRTPRVRSLIKVYGLGFMVFTTCLRFYGILFVQRIDQDLFLQAEQAFLWIRGFVCCVEGLSSKFV